MLQGLVVIRELLALGVLASTAATCGLLRAVGAPWHLLAAIGVGCAAFAYGAPWAYVALTAVIAGQAFALDARE